MSYDEKCWDLAESFLQEYPEASDEHKAELAQEIQTVIEDFLKFTFDNKDEEDETE